MRSLLIVAASLGILSRECGDDEPTPPPTPAADSGTTTTPGADAATGTTPTGGDGWKCYETTGNKARCNCRINPVMKDDRYVAPSCTATYGCCFRHPGGSGTTEEICNCVSAEADQCDGVIATVESSVGVPPGSAKKQAFCPPK